MRPSQGINPNQMTSQLRDPKRSMDAQDIFTQILDTAIQRPFAYPFRPSGQIDHGDVIGNLRNADASVADRSRRPEKRRCLRRCWTCLIQSRS